MNTITLPRAVVEQALKALEGAAECVQQNYLPDKCGHDWDEQIIALRAALAQQDEPVAYTTGHCENHKQKGGCQLHNLQCGWPDCDRKPTTASSQQAEPAQEPAFHGFMSTDGTRVDLCFTPSAPRSDGAYATAYYTAPPQHQMTPLTEEEIWQNNDIMAANAHCRLMLLELVTLVRAVEQVYGIKEKT